MPLYFVQNLEIFLPASMFIIILILNSARGLKNIFQSCYTRHFSNLTKYIIVRTSNHVLYVSNVSRPDFFLLTRAQMEKKVGLAGLDMLLTYNT